MNEILTKVQKLIDEANINEDFHSKYADHLVGTGERSSDYSAYYFDISDDYYLIMDFVDFSYQDFSLVNNKHKQLINLV